MQIVRYAWRKERKTSRTISQLIPSAVSLKITGVEQLCQVKRMIGGSGNMFCSFSHEKTHSGTRAFHDVCCSKLSTFHNGFMFFDSLSCFKHFFRSEAQVHLTFEKVREESLCCVQTKGSRVKNTFRQRRFFLITSTGSRKQRTSIQIL